MLSTILVVAAIFGLIIGLMSVGVIFANKPVQGSCGGLSAIGMKSACDVCKGKDECERKKQARLAAANDDARA